MEVHDEEQVVVVVERVVEVDDERVLHLARHPLEDGLLRQRMPNLLVRDNVP